jgi:hypothetical protein
MKTSGAFVVTTMVLVELLGAGVARAEQVLATAPLQVLSINDSITCVVADISTRPVTVATEIHEAGIVVNPNVQPVTISDGFILNFVHEQGAGAYCKFIVTQGHAKDLRASAVYSISGQTIVIPAQ